jgi:hypothetical protein
MGFLSSFIKETYGLATGFIHNYTLQTFTVYNILKQIEYITLYDIVYLIQRRPLKQIEKIISHDKVTR